MRVGVNIPDELLKRFEPLKSRVNISQVCREAITSMVEKYERNITSLDGIETQEAISKISEQELEWVQVVHADWEQFGYEDAVNWVKAAGWQDWDLWLRTLILFKKQGRPEWETQPPFFSGNTKHSSKGIDDRIQEYFATLREQGDEFQDWCYENDLYINLETARRDYHRAWTAYVSAAWDKIQRTKDEHYENLMQHRGEQSEYRTKFEVPVHLYNDTQPQAQQPFRVVPHHAKLADGVDPLKLNHFIDRHDVELFQAEEENTQ